MLVRIDGYGNHPVLHPLVQVRGYCDYLTDIVVTLAEDEHELAGTAYLHNATNLGIADLRDMASPDPARPARMFSGQDRSDFLDFLRSRFSPGVPGAGYADRLLSSRTSRSILGTYRRPVVYALAAWLVVAC